LNVAEKFNKNVTNEAPQL